MLSRPVVRNSPHFRFADGPVGGAPVGAQGPQFPAELLVGRLGFETRRRVDPLVGGCNARACFVTSWLDKPSKTCCHYGKEQYRIALTQMRLLDVGPESLVTKPSFNVTFRIVRHRMFYKRKNVFRIARWLFAFLLVAAWIGFAGRSIAGADLESPKFHVPKFISAFTPDGKPVQLVNGGITDFVIMATWCPYSKQLKRFLNDPITRPYAQKRRLIFLFSRDEWPDVEAELKDGGLSGTQLKQQLSLLKQRSGSASLFDPSFLDDVPGDVYLCNLPDHDGYPFVISGTGRDKIGWMTVDLRMPESLLLPTFKKYAPKR